jgi:catechol 2,3-dioxygenase-like lactoylglutathione lyase family enzyme
MARIKHIALTTENPAKTAAFYKEAFGLKELRRSPNGAVFLTDGYIHVAVLKTKGAESADMGAHGPHFTGIHHFGFEVDDLPGACEKLEGADAERLTAKTGDEATAYAEIRAGHANFEMKWAGPDGVVIDISHTGWEGTH